LDIKEFISSGILEAYVSGIATPEEIKQVREMEELYPEIKNEIDAIESFLVSYSETLTKLPSAETKNKIQNRLFKSGNNNEAKVIGLKAEDGSRRNSVFRFVAAACIAALMISTTFNFILSNKFNKIQDELTKIRNENNELAEQMDELQTTLFEKNNELAIIMKPGSKIVSLKGMGNSPSSHAMIVWNPKDKMVLLNSISLPAPPEGMQYQLWALMDGKTVNAGVFDLNEGGSVMLKMQDMPPAQAFAVTLEKIGGSKIPNMNAMYLMGNV
jgi:anti-sigma-K factor RskA